MEKQIKIREIEMDILNVLRSGVEVTLDIATQLNRTYSAVHSVLNRMVMYDIAQRKGNGIYSPVDGNFVVAPDVEVVAYRRKRQDRLSSKATSDVLNIDPEIINFVRTEYCNNVDRSIIQSRLKDNGVHINKYMVNQIIYTYGMDQELSKQNREKITNDVVEFVRLQYFSNVEGSIIQNRLKENGVNLSKFNLNQIIYA
ncbi:hypothetical protein [Paenibacillus polymyxa]|uniref:hypothetical protein n=1 Tax=Paenibacillus polymyxa TaxID=1406 RepID=UPI00021BBB48|nr:hypothetical protein [Paenibacillus polymyxa]MDN4107015.1 hypothetical protein [Paenibacillus polymyxa]CCC86242.1 hypothetical protein PPM_p0092 [Paenibacillus polymyxa M1]